MPVVEGDHAVIGAALHARRTRVLLTTAHTVRKSIVSGHVVQGRSWLRVPWTPRLTAVT